MDSLCGAATDFGVGREFERLYGSVVAHLVAASIVVLAASSAAAVDDSFTANFSRGPTSDTPTVATATITADTNLRRWLSLLQE
jgi:hypothetical protein